MKIRKSIVLLLVCIAFAVICCACSETSGENPGQDSADNSSVTETIRIDVNQYTMNIGDSVKITADKECSWSVSDAGIVSVNDKGLVTAVGLGQANVVAEYKGAKDTCVITVTDELLGEPDLSINIKSERLIVNEMTEVFPIAVFGSKVADNSVLDYRVTSSDSSVISVNGFKLKGEREGNATVKVELTYKGKNYSVNKNVTVKEVSDIWFEKEEERQA